MLVATICALFFSLILFSESTTIQQYCDIDPENSPCLYKCVRGSGCGNTGEKYRSLTDAEREVVVKVHNEVRQKVAKGDYASKNLPAASNMQVMSYDLECEFMAGCYIKQCIMEHDELRVSLKYENMGQNLYTMAAQQKIPMDHHFITRGIKNWFNEIDLPELTPELGSRLMQNFSLVYSIGHLTQVIWPTTNFVGCAVMHNLRNPGSFTYDLFCDYKPPGNQPNKKLYLPGKPNCKTNSVYPNLCGKIRPLSEDDYDPPVEMGGGRKSRGKRVEATTSNTTENFLFSVNLFKILSLLMLYWCT